MRPFIVAAPAALLLTLTACAPTTGVGRYADELRQLTESCEARGGILIASGRTTGRPQTEYLCRVNDGGTRIPDGG